MADNLPYAIAMARPTTTSMFDQSGRVLRDVLDANIDHYCDLIARAADEHGARIIVFPEFELTGYAPVGDAAWIEGSLSFPGPELDRIGAAARAAKAYVVVQATERHPAFLGRFFLSAALFTPKGEIGLVHRKSYAMSLRTSPIDVYDDYIQTFGNDAFFPVLKTELGVMGILIGAEVHWPEAVRALTLKGAEIILNPVSSAPLIDYMGRPGAEGVRSVRAFENVAYLAMSNTPAEDCSAASQVYDFNGAAIGERADEQGRFVVARIDIEALRKARIAPKANFMAQIQPAVHEPLSDLPLWPANAFAQQAASGTDELYTVEKQAWDRMLDLGRGVGPADGDI